jgi:hypothetical protein
VPSLGLCGQGLKFGSFLLHTSYQALIERIHMDANLTRRALEHPSLSAFKEDAFLKPAVANTA